MKRLNYDFFTRGINFVKREILFNNVKNSNIRDLAYKNYCYKKMEKKYKNVIENYKPIQKEMQKKSNYVWVCWLQGIENAPELVKSCIKTIKNNFKDKQVIVLTNENLKKYVELPDYIEKKRNKGMIPNALYSDLIRLRLLNKYGGLWCDATVFISGEVKKEFWNMDLFVFKEVSLFQKEELPIRASNWLIYSTSNNNILLLTERLLYEYYKKEMYIKNYYIFHLFFSMATKKFEEEWKKIPTFPNVNNHLMQFELLNKYEEDRWKELINLTNFHKLNRRIETTDKATIYYHIINGE